MLRAEKTVLLASGEALKAEEIAEAFWLLAESESSYPFMSQQDRIQAAIGVMFELLNLHEVL